MTRAPGPGRQIEWMRPFKYVVAYFGVTDSTIRDWVKLGHLRAFREQRDLDTELEPHELTTKLWFIDDDLSAWAEKYFELGDGTDG